MMELAIAGRAHRHLYHTRNRNIKVSTCQHSLCTHHCRSRSSSISHTFSRPQDRQRLYSPSQLLEHLKIASSFHATPYWSSCLTTRSWTVTSPRSSSPAAVATRLTQLGWIQLENIGSLSPLLSSFTTSRDLVCSSDCRNTSRSGSSRLRRYGGTWRR